MTAFPNIQYTEDDPLQVKDAWAVCLLRRILGTALAPLGYDKSLQRYRQTSIIESGTVTTVTTVATVTNCTTLANFGIGRNAEMMLNAQVNAAWALNVRARIT